MKKWFTLVAAIASEVTATLARKAALDRAAWFILVAAGYLAAFALLAICLRLRMAIGVAYGIWGASGVTATALLSALVFSEPLTLLMGGGIVLSIAGVLTVELGAQKVNNPPTATNTAGA